MDDGNRQEECAPLASGDDYLWDRSGEPDPEIQSLEALLRCFQHNGPTPIFPEISPARRSILVWPRFRLLPVLAALSAVAVGVAVASFWVYGRKAYPGATGWDVSRLAGTPRVGNQAISGKERTGRLGVGQILETDDHSRASLWAEGIGQIEVDPSTHLRLLTMKSALKRIALDRGTIHAYIWAPPGQFIVDTPSALTVDLGCAYTLQVDESGAGLVHTSLGWVGFKLNGREAFIPAGAACATRPKIGPGTPYFEDAASDLRSALARLDFEDSTPLQRTADLAIILAQSRKRDALTLWHLLARVDEAQRILVYDRLQELAPPPPGVTQEGILRLDQAMLDLWWNELGFDNIAMWRYWERSWSTTASPAGQK